MTDNRVRMAEEVRCGADLVFHVSVSCFTFQVSAYFLPLRQGEYPQGEGV